MKSGRWLQFSNVLIFVALVAGLSVAGFRLRLWTWEQTDTIHYTPDMENAWKWGSRAARDGYFSLYDRVVKESPSKQYGLDYVPLRLGVMTLWARWAGVNFPAVHHWRKDYDFNAPLLRLNAFMEYVAALGMFFLVRQWIRKERQPRPAVLWQSWVGFVKRWTNRSIDVRHEIDPNSIRRGTGALLVPNGSDTGETPVIQGSVITPMIEEVSPPPAPPLKFFEGHWLALLAAALVWFDAASITSSFGRPTWDAWVIPFYIWAIFFASRNNWFIAGVLVGVGAMFKGQQVVVAPFFLLWPIFSLRFGAAARWLIGLALGAGLIVSPWLIWLTPSWGPIVLCIIAIIAGPTAWAIARYFSITRRFARVRWAIWIGSFCVAAAIWCSPLLFPVSTAWLKVGFIYGVDKMPNLETGSPASVAAILQNRFGWHSTDPTTAMPFTQWVPSMNALLATIGYVLIAVAALAAAWHARNRDRRFLLAAAAPWLIYFTIFPRMHERYLLWACLMSAAAVAIDVSFLFLHLLLTALSWIMQMDQLLRDGKPRGFGTAISPTFGQSLRRFTQGAIPDSGWAVLLICLIWLWLMFAVRSRRRSSTPTSVPR